MAGRPACRPAAFSGILWPMVKQRCRVGAVVLAVALAGAALTAAAQGGKIWRCGNEYTNNPGPDPAARGCREVLGGNLTIVEGTRPAAASAPAAGGGAAGSPAGNGRTAAERVAPDQQRQRDLEARRILEQELRRAQERLEQARADYAGGQPPRLANERTDGPRYQARVEELRARVERAEADVAALQRELARLPPAPGEGR
ncbi:hypothetical protein Tsedi_00799 [Tepidimonas sediminis]|uniref:DUF4124 domain-containing protein n=2 Tax=Tepidimonas sediminis TaxID=2588941 RepID=A0A554WSF0_9BURK|nr:hypothetical protein Tsedi_00799 [Tepidimonas sediminis]